MTLREHLADRQRAMFRRLLEAIEGLTEADAAAGARPDWRRYRWGSGLDGSIAGIVRHVATWKHLCAATIETGSFPGEASVAAPGAGWPALQEWLVSGQQRLQALLAGTSDGDLERAIAFEEQTQSARSLFVHLIEHDVYHAGQINLLRQQQGHDLSGGRAGA
jgi:uncharacterized damage-inducible protein DinB